MKRLKITLINPNRNITIPLKTKLKIEVFVEAPSEFLAEIIYDTDYFLGDTKQKVQKHSKRSVVKWNLVALNKTNNTEIRITAKSENLVQMAGFGVEII